MPMQIRQSPRPCARGPHAPSATGPRAPGWTATMLRPAGALERRDGPRPMLVPSAARSQLKILHPSTSPSHGATTATRAVAGSDVQTTSAATSALVQGKLLLQSSDSPNGPLRLSLQLVSATVAGRDERGVRGEAAALDAVISSGETEVDVELLWDEALGAPGAVLVTNNSGFPVYLKLLSLSSPAVHFVCNGWVYPVGKHPYRLFFTNDAYVKEKTPPALRKDREDELRLLRGEGAPADAPLQKWDRVYDYALYNDLGNPDLREDLARPVLGGSEEYPYPRRTRTSRPPSKADPASETRASLEEGVYIPCDERTGAVAKAPNLPKLEGHFGSLADVHGLFDTNAKPIAFPVPQVISANRTAWRTDEEFARQTLAGTNPLSIELVTGLPLTSKLDRALYGDQDSKITKEHIEKNLGNMTVAQAIEKDRLYVVDHHDWVMPYLKRINELPGDEEKGEISERKSYATRTLFFLQDDSTLKPLAIELSSPHPKDERLGATSTVYTPPDQLKAGDAASDTFTAWDLAKAHAASNDACKNNYVLHWLRTHATMEPVVIAANRQLSVLHPIHKLLKPHFRNTLDTNSTARHIVIGSGDERQGGAFYRNMHEVNFFTGKYGMEMSSKAYASFNFTELAFPNELIKRGMVRGAPKKPEELELPRNDELNILTAIWKWVTELFFPNEHIKTGVARGDPKKAGELELLIKDYPYAVDGLEIWTAIKEWVTDYCAIYYAEGDGAVAGDSELQAWWSEVRNVGHGDLSDAPWWPAMDSVNDLVETCATIIWLGSAYHSAVSFGQYAYNGFVPNRPTVTSGEMPADAGAAVTEAEFLGHITPKNEAFGLMALTMSPPVKPGEPLMGERPDTARWTSEQRAAKALLEFNAKLDAVAEAVKKRNADGALRNRNGPVEVPYTLLAPRADPAAPHVGGIPNSIAV
ncbi:seed linoleate 9S-lipoxygenase-3-like isoform X1 [Triticum urartu]|uniref:seed linoleate 9S-lipoxygenase-3-like isoform X1 n=1 Tax=Triticum urartu TaxID=4572 RepID=UPI002042C013|nr:seed linoleate 9S-lipoxygenase-3-like isoform X1 [Triticum urartu]